MLLKNIVDAKHYQFVESYDNWQEAIYGVTKPLLDDGTIEKKYVDSIIENINTYGPYIVILPEVAMPHSTLGGEGVHDTAIGFCKVEKPVEFVPADESKNARLFFTLAAVDDNEHLKNMQMLSELLLNDGIIDDLLKAKTGQDLLEIDKKYSQ